MSNSDSLKNIKFYSQPSVTHGYIHAAISVLTWGCFSDVSQIVQIHTRNLKYALLKKVISY